MHGDLEVYLSGAKLYGDDFSLEEINAWYEDEREGYADLGAGNRSAYVYGYHRLNRVYGFSHLPEGRLERVLGLGSAYGDEFLPIIDRIDALTIIDPSEAFHHREIAGIPISYHKPSPDGSLPFQEGSLDLVTCFGTLHHIPNVTAVVREMHRCLRPAGLALVREPIISMGNWSSRRPGLTKRERGIPLDLLLGIVRGVGFRVDALSYCIFPLVRKLAGRTGIAPYNSALATWIDGKLSKLSQWNLRYHSTRMAHKFRPESVFLVLTRQ